MSDDNRWMPWGAVTAVLIVHVLSVFLANWQGKAFII
jgi:hypothetical protein